MADNTNANDNNSMDVVELEETQLATQSTQQGQDGSNPLFKDNIWGWLQPVNPNMQRIEFEKVNHQYSFGRRPDANLVVLKSMKISNHHATITWDRAAKSVCSVVVHDVSTNGTFINNEKIGKGNRRALFPGHEIAFGTCLASPNHQDEDYRFIFHFTANGRATHGFFSTYDILHELGRGSFATVFKVLQRQSGNFFAAKVIYGQKRLGPGAESTEVNLGREIKILQSMDHPNVCKLEECCFEDNGDLILVLELVEGGDLLTYVIENSPLRNGIAQHLSYQLCEALAYIHTLDIAHRDLKPENVLITKHNPPILKIADFGLAKVVHSATMLKTMCGTPAYLAPEVVRQDPFNMGYDKLVDSWSVGVIIFALLTNETPICEDDSILDMRLRILKRTLDLTALQANGVVPECQDLIKQLLAESPSERISIADALKHPWLSTYLPIYEYDAQRNPKKVREFVELVPPPAASSSGDSGVLVDASMISAAPSASLSAFALLSPPASKNGAPVSGSASQRPPSSRANFLRRRVDVIARAHEGEFAIPEPPSDLRFSNGLQDRQEPNVVNGDSSSSSHQAPQQQQHPQQNGEDDDDRMMDAVDNVAAGRKRRRMDVDEDGDGDVPMDAVVSPVKQPPPPPSRDHRMDQDPEEPIENENENHNSNGNGNDRRPPATKKQKTGSGGAGSGKGSRKGAASAPVQPRRSARNQKAVTK